MFRAATAGVDSAPYVQQILGGGEGEEEEGEAPEGDEDDGGAAQA
tara:strand:+ start:440 stop:574 length:135 start_codon:yes stop_codon:yes gene_type:complete